MYENANKKHSLGNPDFWIGATPVGRGQIVSQWLDGTKIVNYFWISDSSKSGHSDCNALVIDTHYNEPTFYTYSCSTTISVICQLDDQKSTKPKVITPVIDTQQNLDSLLNRTIETIDRTTTKITHQLRNEIRTQARSFDTLISSFRSDLESIELCKRLRDTKTNEARALREDLTEKKSTILKMMEELRN